MLAGFVTAGIFNSQRSKRTDKVWKWTDLHPAHAGERSPMSGAQITATAFAVAGDVQWDFAPGYTLERIIGGVNVSQSN
jgi:hypothetical protein